jgi:hypothetical protein
MPSVFLPSSSSFQAYLASVTLRARRDMKGFIKEMIAETTSMDAEKAASLTGSIDGLYVYASDLHHIVDNQGKVKEDIYTGGKEDAYMVYLISTSFANLLRGKFITLTAKMNPRA